MSMTWDMRAKTEVGAYLEALMRQRAAEDTRTRDEVGAAQLTKYTLIVAEAAGDTPEQMRKFIRGSYSLAAKSIDRPKFVAVCDVLGIDLKSPNDYSELLIAARGYGETRVIRGTVS